MDLLEVDIYPTRENVCVLIPIIGHEHFRVLERPEHALLVSDWYLQVSKLHVGT